MLFVRYRATEDFVEQFLFCCPLAKHTTRKEYISSKGVRKGGVGVKTLGFGGNLHYRLRPETVSPLFADLSSTTHVYDCVWR